MTGPRLRDPGCGTGVGAECGICGAPVTTNDGIVGMDLCNEERCLDAAWDIAFPPAADPSVGEGGAG